MLFIHFIEMEDTCQNCGNKELTFVLATIANGQKRVRKQCLKCGSSESMVYKHSLFKNYLALPLYQPELKQQFIDNQFKNRDLRLQIGAKDYYNDVYMKSDEWAAKRQNILDRDDNKCRCCNEQATQVHHISYNNVYQEKSKQLISVCKECHHEIHFGHEIHLHLTTLIANFNVLKLCQHCESYHNDESSHLCDKCKNQ